MRLVYVSQTTEWFHCLKCSKGIIEAEKGKSNKEVFDRIKKILRHKKIIRDKKTRYEFINQ